MTIVIITIATITIVPVFTGIIQFGLVIFRYLFSFIIICYNFFNVRKKLFFYKYFVFNNFYKNLIH
jgi:hypothetical protein